MKFFCQQCNTKYSIADEKVRGKILKIRCKKCKAIIVVREKKKPAARSAGVPGAARSAQRSPVSSPQRTRSQRSSSAPMAATASAPAAQLQPDNDRDDATRVTSLGEMQHLLDRADGGASARAQPAAGRARGDLLWYLASKGKQSRPMTQAQIGDKIRKGQVGPRVFAWNQTMKDWVRLSKIDVFRADFDAIPDRGGGQVVDFQKKVAERRAAEARKRERAVDALDQIAELVRQAPIEPEPVREPSRSGVVPSGAHAEVAQASSELPEDSFEDLFFDPASVASFVTEGVEKDALGDAPLSAGGLGADIDPFSMVADHLPPTPPKESTRVFVAAAGLKNRARKQKIYAVIGISIGLLLVGSIALDAVGVIEIPLLHGYVQSVKLAATGKKKTVIQAPVEDYLPLTETERQAIRKALLEGNMAVVAAVRRKARRRVKLALHVPSGAAGVDLSDNVHGAARDSDPSRRGTGVVHNVELSTEDLETLKGIDERSGIDPVAIRIKQGIGKIKLPVIYKGGLEAKQIAQVVGENQKSIQRCATQETRRGVELPPSINMSLTIEISGAVSHTRVSDASVRNSPLGRCLSNTVKQWRFPSFTGQPMDVDIPFKFTTIH